MHSKIDNYNYNSEMILNLVDVSPMNKYLSFYELFQYSDVMLQYASLNSINLK